ncbi:MAG TPA: MOSC domain-containing protein [Actinomycetota bacterium]|nr:MOSC domain-containing protein [Actinomycetota bacterium]
MEPVRDAALEEGGLAGDAHFEPQSIRQLLLADAEALEALDLAPGDIRENLTLRGIGVMQLRPGATLAVGEAEVEITKECTPCRRLDEVRPGLMRELSGQRGMYARVVRPGMVRPGDAVHVIEPALSRH